MFNASKPEIILNKRIWPQLRRAIAITLCLALLLEQSAFAQVAGQLNLSRFFSPQFSQPSDVNFRPIHLRSVIGNNQQQDLRFLADKGDFATLRINKNITADYEKIVKYFYIGLALPNESFWVNLRPDSPKNLIDPALAFTDAGKILLEADLQLKKDTASYTNPTGVLGKDYWQKLYAKAEELFGNAPQTIPTLVRPWIVPGDIIIVERGDSAYVYKATLKVMLEQDYLKGNAMYKFSDPRQKALNEYSAEIVRKNIIPALTKEINSGKKYAALRQLYYSLILAQWFKQKHYGTNSAYGRLINNRDLTGLCSLEPWSKSEYFKAYKESFQKGEYNIRADAYSLGNMVVRTYFSGGISLIAMIGAQRAGEPVPTARVVRSQPGLPEVVPTYIGSFVGPREGPVLLEGEDQVGAEEGGFPAAGDTAAAVSADSQSRPEGGSWFGNILNRIQAFFKGSLSAEAVDYDDYIQPSEAAEALMDKVEEAVAEVAENPHSTEIFPLQEELRPLLELRHGLTWLRQQALGLNADTHMSDVDITRMFLILASLRKRLEAIKSARATNRGKYSIDKVEELAVRIDQINSAYNLIRAKDSLSIHERRQILKTISAELGDLRQSIEAIEKRLRSSESKISHASTLAIKPDEWLRNYVYVSYYGWLRDYTQGRQSLPDITAQRRKIVDLIIGYIFDANNGYLGDLQDPKIKIQERQELLDSAVEEIINNDVYAIILAELGFDAGSGISEEVENMRRATFAFGGSIIAQTDLNQEGVINPETVIGLMNLAEQWHTALTWLQEKFSAPQLNNNKASWWRRPAPAFSFATFALILITTAILSSMAPASADTLHHPGHGQAMSMLSGDMPQGIVAPDKLIQQLPSSAIAAIFDKPSTAATQPAGVDYSLDPARSHHAPSPAPVSKHIPIYKSPAATQGQPLSTGDSNLDPNHTTAAAQHRVLLPTDANFMADNNGADTVTAITPQADASPLPGLKVADAEEATSGPTPPTLSPAVTSPEPVMAAEALPVILPEVTGQRTTMPQQALLDKPDDKALPAATPTIGPPSTLSPEPPPEAKSVEPQQQPQVISPPHQDSAAVSGPPPGVKAAEPQQPPQIIPSLGSHDSVGAVGPPPQPGNYHHPIAAPPSATVSPPPHQASVATAEPPPEQFLAPQGKSINAYFGGYTVDGGEFGAQRKGYIHHGYDVALEAGTRIPVPMAGRVTEVRYGVAGIGNCITIKLDNGWELQYHHMATNGLAREGDVLRAGQVVGYVAGIEDVPATENGRRFWSGPHVHVQLDNAEHDLVNPARYWPQLVGDQTAAVGAQPGAANGSSTEDIIARVDAVLSPGTQYSGSAEQPPKKDIRIVTPTGFETTASPGEALLPVDDFVPQGFSQKDLEPYYKIIQMGQSHDLKNVDALLKIVKTWDDSKYWNTVTNRNRANFNILGIVTKLLVSPFSGAWDLASGVKTEVSLNSIFDFFRGNRIHRLALLNEPEPSNRVAACWALGNLGPSAMSNVGLARRIVFGLQEVLLKDKDPSARAVAAWALSQYGVNNNAHGGIAQDIRIKGLEQATADKEWLVRLFAARALATSGDPRCISPLINLLQQEDNPYVLYEATAAVINTAQRFSSYSALAPLIQATAKLEFPVSEDEWLYAADSIVFGKICAGLVEFGKTSPVARRQVILAFTQVLQEIQSQRGGEKYAAINFRLLPLFERLAAGLNISAQDINSTGLDARIAQALSHIIAGEINSQNQKPLAGLQAVEQDYQAQIDKCRNSDPQAAAHVRSWQERSQFNSMHLTALYRPDSSIYRVLAMDALSQNDNGLSLQVFIKGLEDSHPLVRAAAARGLRNHMQRGFFVDTGKDSHLAKALLKAAEDKELMVIAYLTDALTSQGNSDALAIVSAALNSSRHPEVLKIVSESLSRFTNENQALREPLIKLLEAAQDSDYNVLVFALNAAGEVLKSGYDQALVDQIVSAVAGFAENPRDLQPYNKVREAGLGALHTQWERSRQRLQELSEEYSARNNTALVNAVQSLLQEPNVSPGQGIQDYSAIWDGPEVSRIAAIKSLAEKYSDTKDIRAVENLLRLIEAAAPANSRIVQAAIEALSKIDPKAAGLAGQPGENRNIIILGKVANNDKLANDVRITAINAAGASAHPEAAGPLAAVLSAKGQDADILIAAVSAAAKVLAAGDDKTLVQAIAEAVANFTVNPQAPQFYSQLRQLAIQALNHSQYSRDCLQALLMQRQASGDVRAVNEIKSLLQSLGTATGRTAQAEPAGNDSRLSGLLAVASNPAAAEGSRADAINNIGKEFANTANIRAVSALLNIVEANYGSSSNIVRQALTAICAIDPQATAIVSPEGKNPVIETLSKVAFDASLSLPLDLRRQALTALAKTGKQEAAGRLANVLNTSTNTQLILDAASGAIIFLGNADENMLKDALVNALFVKLFSTSDLIQVGPNEFARYMQIRAEALNLLTRADIDQRLKVLISDREASADYSAVNALRALQQALINPQLDARLSAYLDKACASSAPQAERIAALDAMAKESAATANTRAVLHLINIINEGAASDSVLLGAAIRALAKIDPKATALLYPSGQNPLLDTFGRIAGNNSFPDGLRREASRALVLTGQQQAGRVLANALMGKDPLFVLSVVNDIRSLLAREPGLSNVLIDVYGNIAVSAAFSTDARQEAISFLLGNSDPRARLAANGAAASLAGNQGAMISLLPSACNLLSATGNPGLAAALATYVADNVGSDNSMAIGALRGNPVAQKIFNQRLQRELAKPPRQQDERYVEWLRGLFGAGNGPAVRPSSANSGFPSPTVPRGNPPLPAGLSGPRSIGPSQPAPSPQATILPQAQPVASQSSLPKDVLQAMTKWRDNNRFGNGQPNLNTPEGLYNFGLQNQGRNISPSDYYYILDNYLNGSDENMRIAALFALIEINNSSSFRYHAPGTDSDVDAISTGLDKDQMSFNERLFRIIALGRTGSPFAAPKLMAAHQVICELYPYLERNAATKASERQALAHSFVWAMSSIDPSAATQALRTTLANSFERGDLLGYPEGELLVLLAALNPAEFEAFCGNNTNFTLKQRMSPEGRLHSYSLPTGRRLSDQERDEFILLIREMASLSKQQTESGNNSLELYPAINQLIWESDPAKRASVAARLGDFNDIRAVSFLIAALGDEDASVQIAAARSLGKLETAMNKVDVRLDAFARALKESHNQFLRAQIAYCLGTSGDPRAIALIQDLLLDEKNNSLVTSLAAVSAGELAIKFANVNLIEALLKVSADGCRQDVASSTLHLRNELSPQAEVAFDILMGIGADQRLRPILVDAVKRAVALDLKKQEPSYHTLNSVYGRLLKAFGPEEYKDVMQQVQPLKRRFWISTGLGLIVPIITAWFMIWVARRILQRRTMLLNRTAGRTDIGFEGGTLSPEATAAVWKKAKSSKGINLPPGRIEPLHLILNKYGGIPQVRILPQAKMDDAGAGGLKSLWHRDWRGRVCIVISKEFYDEELSRGEDSIMDPLLNVLAHELTAAAHAKKYEENPGVAAADDLAMYAEGRLNTEEWLRRQLRHLGLVIDSSLEGNGSREGTEAVSSEYSWSGAVKSSQEMITNCNDILERGEGISEEDVSYILITAYQALSRLPLASTQHNNSGDQCIEEREKLSEDMLAILERAISLVRAKIESSPEDTHRQKLISYLYECVEYARYWIDYNLALNNLVSLSFFKNYPERIEAMWGFQEGKEKARLNVLFLLPRIYERGNSLCPELYPVPNQDSGYVGIINEYYANLPPPNRQLGILPEMGERKSITREWPLWLGIVAGILTFLGGVYPVWISYSVGGAVFLTAASTIFPLLGFFISSGANTYYINKGLTREQNDYLSRHGQINSLISGLRDRFPRGPTLLAQEIENLKSAISKEMGAISADVIVISTGDYDNAGFRPYVESLVNAGVPVFFVNDDASISNPKLKGSAMPFCRAYDLLDPDITLGELSKKMEEDRGVSAIRPLSGLAHPDKYLRDARVIVIYAGGPKYQFVSDPVGSPQLEYNGRRLNRLQMALANGYRISQQLSSQQRPGIVNLNGDGTYLGPIEKIPHYSEFQLIASWGSYEQMENNDLGFFLMDDALKLLKYYDKLSRKQDIPGSFERDAVRGKYDLDNARKRQLLISCGILITSFRNVERWRSFRALTQELTHYLYQFEGSENGNEVPFTMRNFPDIVIPFVMRWRWERIHDYAETRVRGRGYPEKDIRANAQARRFYDSWLDIMLGGYGFKRAPRYSFSLQASYPGESLYSRGDVSGLGRLLDEYRLLEERKPLNGNGNANGRNGNNHAATRPPLRSRKGGFILNPLSSSMVRDRVPVPAAPSQKGGIDLALKPSMIRTQAMPDSDWEEIQRLLSAGIRPSAMRIVEYLGKDNVNLESRIQNVRLCLADMLRLEEMQGYTGASDTTENLLVLIETTPSAEEIPGKLEKLQIKPLLPKWAKG